MKKVDKYYAEVVKITKEVYKDSDSEQEINETLKQNEPAIKLLIKFGISSNQIEDIMKNIKDDLIKEKENHEKERY